MKAIKKFSWKDWAKTLKDIHQDKRSPDRYLSPEHPEYEAGMSVSTSFCRTCYD